jgi:hypothetical protein
MGIKSPTNVSPYYDDFNINKNFHRVMFVPGLAVQTRELTQLQTILQNQIERVGDNLFVEGTILEGCDFQYETVPYVKLRDNDSGGNTVSVTAFANGIVEGLTSGVRAKIVATAEGAEASAPNYNTFLVKYIDGGTSKTNKTFANNEVLVFKPADGGSGQTANTISSGAFGTGSIFSTGEGLIYGKGFVVRSEPQTLVLERYSVSPSYKVGFDIEESFITSDNDSTLLDNAIGSYNETAPGAHRLKLTPTLVKRVLTDTANTSQLSPIFTVENGNIRVVKQTTVYDDIGREMANRTYEESGNYMVKHINTEVKEHLDTGTNFGRYSSTDLPAGDKNKLAIGITPGVAYVQGYRNEVLTTEYIDTDKATDTEQELGINVTTNYGNYVIVNELAGPWDPTEFETISLRNAAANSISSATLGSTAAPGSEIGTARVRHVAYRSGTKGKPDGQYRLYIFDVKMSSGTFADVRSFYVNNASGPDNFADAVLENGSAVLKEPSFNRVVFTTGAPAVQTLTNNVGTINTSYTFRDKSTVSFNTSGTATLSITGVHAGGTEEFPYGTGALNSTQKRDFMVIAGSTVQTTNNAGFASFTAGSNTIVGNGSSTFSSNYAVDDFIQFANTTGGTTNTLRVVSTAGASSMIVTPAPSIDSGTANTTSGATHSKIFPAGYIFDMTQNGTAGVARTISVSTSTTAALDIKESLTSSLSTTTLFNNKRETAVGASKLVRKDRYVKIDLNTVTEGIVGPWNLGIADVFNIQNVYLGSTYSTTNRNVTNDFRVIVNSNDNLYDHSKLALKENSSLTLTTSDKLLIELDYFEHDVSSGIGFFSVDSYVIDPNESTSNTSAIVTPQIPRYSSSSGGLTFDLRNSIDFRPRIVSTAADSTTVSGATENPATSTTLDIDSDGSYVPVADENFTSDLLYYLPRIDRVVMGKDGKKKVVKGIPGDTPVPPLEPAESITLSTMYIPPFPSLSLENAYNFNRVDQAVRVKPFFHKRYTMRDIAQLEKRIDRVEYYTALNVLEKAAKDLSIADGAGLNRFKNGIFVDAFFGHNNANLLDPSYNVSIDTKKGELRPKFDQASLDLTYVSGSSTNVTRKGKQVRLDVSANTIAYENGDIVYVGSTLGTATAAGTVRTVVANSSIARLYLHNSNGTFTATTTLKDNATGGTSTINDVDYPEEGALLTLPYNHSIYIDQPFASRVINPVGELSFNWVGNLDLFPEADHWVDTTQQPDVQFDLDLASNWQSLQNAWGTNWNEWNTTTSFRETERQVAVTGVNVVGGGDGNNPHGALDEVTIEQTDTTVRTGTRLNVEVFNRTQSSGPFVRRTDIIPFMRSREIQFQATGMRPNTRVYPYFDNVRVAEYTTPTTSAFANTGAAGAALVTNANGAVFGVFTLPNNGTLKFRQGERPFRLVDIANTATQSGTQTTSSETMYTSLGLAQATQGITMNTREARVSSDTVNETRTVTSSFTGLQVHRDPVAQSFRIGDFEFNNLNIGDNSFGLGADGVFVSCIDLYFSQKSATNGIGVEIREMQNGQITAVRVPFGWKRIDPGDVNVSTDGSNPTPFYFDQPVYLRGDKEYAFIVKPDGSDPNYRMFISELGETDTVTGAIIDQQPAVGVLFTSANDRTYTPRQNQDVCFTIWRADFNKNVSGTAIFNNDADEYLNINQISSSRFQIGEKIRGEALLRVFGNTAAFTVGDNVTFGSNTGQVRKIITSGGNYILKTDMKGSIASGANVTLSGTSIYYATVNTFATNTASGFVQYVNRGFGELIANNSTGTFTANTTESDGFYRGQLSNAYAQVTAIKDQKYDVLVPKISQAKYVDTDITWGIRTTSNTYTTSSTYTNVENLENNGFRLGERIVASRTNEVNNTSGVKTLFVRGTLSSNTSRLSPVVDIGRTKSIITVHNIINNDNTGETGNYGNAAARYITKKVTLTDGQEAEDLKVFTTAYKPSGTEIDVYARIQNESDGEEFRDKQYTKLTQITASNTFSSILNSEDFVELEYGFPSANATAQSAFLNGANNNVVRYSNSDGAYFDTFKYFSIKIVLRSSTGSHVIPRIKDLRGIALQV